MMDAQVAVIGVGSVGSMALWQLARRGISTIGFERYAPGHDQAAAGGESRIFRTAYLEGPQYVPLLLRSRQLWRELEQETGRGLLTLNGGLMIGSPELDSVGNVLRSARDYHIPHEVLDTEDLRRRYPQHRVRPGEIAVLDEWAGVLRPEFAVLAAAQRAEALGARVVSGERVTGLEPVAGGVRVHVGDRAYTAEQAIVTAGPWTADFAPELAAHVTARKLVMTWYPALDVDAYRPGRFPIFIRESGGTHIFGMPTLDGGSVKVASNVPERDLDHPDTLDRNVAPENLAEGNRVVAQQLSGLGPTPVRVSVYLEAYTTDGHGLVGRMPNTENVWLLGAFSGHGFKMASAFGEIAAELATDGKTQHSIDHLDPTRFLP